MKQLALLMFPLALTLSACGSSSTSTTGGGGGGLCGTGGNVIGYQAYAASVFNTSCVTGCHQSGGEEPTFLLDSYSDAMSAFISNGNNTTEISSGDMPPSGSPSITANQQCIIETWVSQGYPQ